MHAFPRRITSFAAWLGLAASLALVPSASAVPYCDSSYCIGKPPWTRCGCPPYTDRPGASATCGSWNQVGVCWYENAAATTEPLQCPADPAPAQDPTWTYSPASR